METVTKRRLRFRGWCLCDARAEDAMKLGPLNGPLAGLGLWSSASGLPGSVIATVEIQVLAIQSLNVPRVRPDCHNLLWVPRTSGGRPGCTLAGDDDILTVDSAVKWMHGLSPAKSGFSLEIHVQTVPACIFKSGLKISWGGPRRVW